MERYQDWSIKQSEPQSEWISKAENRIKHCQLVIVLLGEKTHNANGVTIEIKLAIRNDIPVVQFQQEGTKFLTIEG